MEAVSGQIEIFPSELREGSYLSGKLVLIGKSAESFDRDIELAWEETVAVPANIKKE